MTLRVLDPTHEQDAAVSARAHRPSSLEGTVVGVISNGKEGAFAFFELLGQLLRERHGVAELVYRVKTSYSAPAEAELLEEAKRWHAVVTGVGD